MDRMRLKAGVEQHAHPRGFGKNFGRKGELLRWQTVEASQYSSDISPWPCVARDETEGNGIRDIGGNDGNGVCQPPHGDCELGVARNHDVWLKPHQFVSEHWPTRQIAVAITPDDFHIAARGISEFLHALGKGPLVV